MILFNDDANTFLLHLYTVDDDDDNNDVGDGFCGEWQNIYRIKIYLYLVQTFLPYNSGNHSDVYFCVSGVWKFRENMVVTMTLGFFMYIHNTHIFKKYLFFKPNKTFGLYMRICMSYDDHNIMK